MQIRTIGAQVLRKRAGWIALAAAALALLLLGFFYRRFVLSGLDLVGEATGGRTSAALCLLLALLVLAWLVVWLSFPIFVYLGLRDLRRRTAELDRTMKLCLQNPPRGTIEPAGKLQDPPDPPPPGHRT